MSVVHEELVINDHTGYEISVTKEGENFHVCCTCQWCQQILVNESECEDMQEAISHARTNATIHHLWEHSKDRISKAPLS